MANVTQGSGGVPVAAPIAPTGAGAPKPPPSINPNQIPANLRPGAQSSPFNFPNYIGGYGGYTPHPPGYSDGVPNPGIGQQQNPSPQQFNPSAYLTDPGYLAALAAQQQGESQLQAQLHNQIAQAIINYGDPSLASEADFGLDNQSAAFARQNYLAGTSTKAQIDQANKQAQQKIVNQLAGSGLLFSGETGYQQGLQGQTYANNVYDAQQAVLNAIAGYRSDALQQEQGLQQSVVQSLEQAYTNMVNQEIANAYSYQPGGAGGGGMNPGGVTQPSPTSPVATAVARALSPYAVRVSANPTGGSANRRQGVFAIH